MSYYEVMREAFEKLHEPVVGSEEQLDKEFKELFNIIQQL